ncbi:MAG: HNH endonuclease [Chloroflexi bacterium]|nr:HNH endonuclease [Chloroflexota bacterium]MBU1747937.1 HNH endonuclease [Chloroflexota bacterium]MBU1877705.1 HNH endonuclease [Chloroflexota bacterium]
MNTAVLVLNQNFEPLNVCNTRRAMGLLLCGKAEMLQNGRGFICTTTRQFPRPAVIRMCYLVRRSPGQPRLSRREVFRRDNYVCQYCGQPGRSLTLDHVIPRHRGGVHSWDNLVTACRACNRRKGGRTPEEAGMQLLHAPYRPPANPYQIFVPLLAQYQEWTEFLSGWI